jgi:rRNA-processing protein FCF1
MKILIDTNFVLTCVKQKIDFSNLAEELFDEKIEWLVPQDVLNELGVLKDRKGMKVADRTAAKTSFEILEKIGAKVVELGGKNPNVDIKIVNYILDKEIILATLDRNLKGRVKNQILTIRGKKMIEII